MGTPHYISPEQARGQRDLDAKTDLYSLGATLYHMLTGKAMFEGATSALIMTQAHHRQSAQSRGRGRAGQQGTVAVLAKLLAKDRADRYESAEKLAEDFDRVAVASRRCTPSCAGQVAVQRPASAWGGGSA